MKRIVWLLAIVGAMLGLVFSQTGTAFEIPDRERQPCQEEERARGPMFLNGSSEGGANRSSDEFGRQPQPELSNEAEQCNGELDNEAKNEPYADIDQKNINKNPQFTLFGNNSQTNHQSNRLWLDQSQNAPAVQANILGQGIADYGNGGRGGPGGPHVAWFGGGGAPLSNEADQSNHELDQEAENKPDAYIDQWNVNFNPQFTLVGDNTQTNHQSNKLWLDQSQNAPAAQVNVAEQSIYRGLAPPVDPVNDADQSNGELDQEAENKPDADVDQKHVNFNPQFTLVGNNSQSNSQGNGASVDQSQDAGALQGNVAGQALQQG
jgi:hypothetical protein